MKTLVILLLIGGNSFGSWQRQIATFADAASCEKARADIDGIQLANERLVCWQNAAPRE